ncbi:polysaccharide biosynthesis/export family protein [Salibacteraceae bacterium]|nr:polysaccharide biosynthesis/export family protein [Salibacteraceae bacterium]
MQLVNLFLCFATECCALNQYRIKQDSTINLPLLGQIKAAGKTLDMLQAAVRLKAAKQYPGSEVDFFNWMEQSQFWVK